MTSRDCLEALLERLDLERRLVIDPTQRRLAEVGDLGTREATDEALRAHDADLDSFSPSSRTTCLRSSTTMPPARSASSTSLAHPAWWSWFPSTATIGTERPAHASARTSACSGRPWVGDRPPEDEIDLRSEGGESSRQVLAERLGGVDVTCRRDPNRRVHSRMDTRPGVSANAKAGVSSASCRRLLRRTSTRSWPR